MSSVGQLRIEPPDMARAESFSNFKKKRSQSLEIPGYDAASPRNGGYPSDDPLTPTRRKESAARGACGVREMSDDGTLSSAKTFRCCALSILSGQN